MRRFIVPTNFSDEGKNQTTVTTVCVETYSNSCIISHLESSLPYSVCSSKFCANDGLKLCATGVAITAELLTLPSIDIANAILSAHL
jgi:hypothetical protein